VQIVAMAQLHRLLAEPVKEVPLRVRRSNSDWKAEVQAAN